MKIILLNTPQDDQVKITRDMAGGLGINASNQIILPPLELITLAAVLKQKKHHPIVLDPTVENLSSKETIKKIIKLTPDIIIGTISLPSIRSDAKFLKKLRGKTTASVIAKTSITHPPILKKILLDSQVDYGLIGEVDLIIDQILSKTIDTGIFRLKAKKLQFILPEPISNLDKLPIPARDLLKNKRYIYPLLGQNCTVIQTSRGCPFDCAYYCPYPLVQGKKWRAMSPQRVYSELEDCVDKNHIKNILFRDATFTLNRQRTISICQKIIDHKLKFSWWCETRINCLDEELMKIMKKAGCHGMNIGVETGDPNTLKTQGKPGVSLEQLQIIKIHAQKIGLKLHFLLIIGLPQENRRSLLLTFQLIKRLNPDSLGVTIVTPYPGTKLFDDATKNKWIKTVNWDKYSGSEVIMKTDNLKYWEMKTAQKALIAEMYFLQKKPLGEIGLFLEEIMFKFWSLL
jgi:radical SAM superfamily enzyme YgiQ (UPF0313 family)